MAIKKAWDMFTAPERKNIMIYIAGIMLYKFGLEAFNGSITTLATDRFDESGTAFEKVGMLNGLNQACQCVGSIMIAPLIKQFPTRSVLSSAIFVFGIMTAILLVVDAATGGAIKTGDEPTYGSYNPNGIFPIFCATGVAYGMVELIRRVIPRDIVGGHVEKLKKMDATVHIFYEIAGTSGAFASAAIIKKLGNNYSFIITPICFTFSAIIWRFVSALDFEKNKALEEELGTKLDKEDRHSGIIGYFVAVGHGFVHFFEAIYIGASIVFTSRKFIWLVPGYSFALLGHRYLENGIANVFAKSVLGDSSYQQIIIGGSNLGELLGAITVFFVGHRIPTPIPYIRLDALLLLIVWYVPYYHPPAKQVGYALRMAATFIPISYGWAAGDVSLAAYIQSSLARVESRSSNVSALGAVMSFLYVTYITLYAIMSPLLGRYVDKMRKEDKLYTAIRNISGVHFSILSGIILLATLIPRGALSLNPSLLEGERLDADLEGVVDEKEHKAERGDSESDSHDGKHEEKSAERRAEANSGLSSIPQHPIHTPASHHAAN